MRTNLDHLSKEKQEELDAVVQVTLERFPQGVEKIILFGSYSRGDHVEELAPDGVNYTYQSDFDILVIVDDKQTARQHHRWRKLEDRYYRSPGVRTPVTLLYHHLDYINEELSRGQYFFADIAKEGILLYNSGGSELTTARKLRPEEFKRQAEEYFDYWFGSASDFVEMYRFAIEKGKLNMAAFNLHQAVERFYASVLLVMTLYKPKGHDIERMGRKVAGHDPELLTVFPQGTAEEMDRFELLRRAYVDSRYKPDYSITREDLEWLEGRVVVLRDLTEKICRRKIDSL